jgi:hypothetical protein
LPKFFTHSAILKRIDAFFPIKYMFSKVKIKIKPDDDCIRPLYPMYKKYFDILDTYLQK